MEIQKNVALSLDKMKHLEELGVDTSDATLSWIRSILNTKKEPRLEMNGFCPVMMEKISNAYTLQDLWDKLPYKIYLEGNGYQRSYNDISLSYTNEENESITFKIDNGKEYYTGEAIMHMFYTALAWIMENKNEGKITLEEDGK